MNSSRWASRKNKLHRMRSSLSRILHRRKAKAKATELIQHQNLHLPTNTRDLRLLRLPHPPLLLPKCIRSALRIPVVVGEELLRLHLPHEGPVLKARKTLLLPLRHHHSQDSVHLLLLQMPANSLILLLPYPLRGNVLSQGPIPALLLLHGPRRHQWMIMDLDMGFPHRSPG